VKTTEACEMYNKTNIKSFDFTGNRFFTKLLRTNHTDIVKM